MKKGDRVIVTFFDSFSMKNRVEEGVLVAVGETSARVEVQRPIRKRIRVPLEYITPA